MWNSHIRVHMLAFPGLEKAYTDHKVLKDIAYDLCSTYVKNMRLSGILYLHRSTYWRSLDVLKALCGPQSFQAITFVTISWEQIDEATSSAREKELKNTEFFRGNRVQNASYYEMSFASQTSAMLIIEPIIKRQKTFVLDIQKTLVDEKLTLDKTGVGLLVAQNASIHATIEDWKCDGEDSMQQSLEEVERLVAKTHKRRWEREQIWEIPGILGIDGEQTHVELRTGPKRLAKWGLFV